MKQHIRQSVMTGVLGGVCVLLGANIASAKEHAPGKKAVCTAAFASYKEAAAESKADHSQDALAALSTCLQATECTGLLPKCRALSTKISEKMPSFVPEVVDGSGTPIVDVQVKVDGRVVKSHLDGLAVLVDPGAHDLEISNEHGVIATQRVLVLEGQHDRPVSILIGAKPAPAPQVATQLSGETPQPVVAKHAERPAGENDTLSSAKSTDSAKPADDGEAAPKATPQGATQAWAMPRSPWPYMIGGVGVAGVVAGALLTAWGNKDNTALENTCNPNCQASSLDHVKSLYVAADVSFGVGAVALAVTTYLFATSHASESSKPADHAGLSVDVQPTRSGALASVSGAF